MAGSNPFDQFDVTSPAPLAGPPAGTIYATAPIPASPVPAPFVLPSDLDAAGGQNPYNVIDPPGGHPGQAGQFVYPSERDPFSDLDAQHGQILYDVIDPPGHGGRNPFDQFDHPAAGHHARRASTFFPAIRIPSLTLMPPTDVAPHPPRPTLPRPPLPSWR